MTRRLNRAVRPVLVAIAAVAVSVSACSGSPATVDQSESSGGLLETVRDRGHLVCGVSGTAFGFSYTQADGSQRGFDADYCRAVAAAVLGDAGAVEFVTLTSVERFAAVQAGAVDVLFRTATHTQIRDTHLGVDFGPVIYYDGQRLMARAEDDYAPSSTVADIDGAVVCANAGTTTERNIVDAAAGAGVEITLDTFENHDIVIENFVARACDIVTGDGSGLVGRKNTAQPEGQEWVIFPPAPISKEPLAPVYAQSDPAWGDVIDWVVYATIIADEKGVTSANVDGMAADPPDAEAQRLLGGEGELQTGMGLAPDAFHQAIRQVGNYNEIFERNLVPVGLTREDSPNARWRDGGLIYAPPAR